MKSNPKSSTPSPAKKKTIAWESYIAPLLNQKDREILFENFDEKTRTVNAVLDRNECNPIAQLIAHSNACLLRYRLDDLSGDYPFLGQYDARPLDEQVTALAVMTTINNDPALFELLENAPYGGRPEFIWQAKPKTLLDLLHDDSGDEQGKWTIQATIQFDHPCLLLIDPYNGSGHTIILENTTIVLPFNPSRVIVDDAEGNGYGWNSIASVVKSYYARFAPTITIKEAHYVLIRESYQDIEAKARACAEPLTTEAHQARQTVLDAFDAYDQYPLDPETRLLHKAAKHAASTWTQEAIDTLNDLSNCLNSEQFVVARQMLQHAREMLAGAQEYLRLADTVDADLERLQM
jgi:hypothetical protein